MPIADPIRCPVCSAPPAEPAIRTGTHCSVIVMFGETTQPLPIPATSRVAAAADPGPGRRASSSRTSAVATKPEHDQPEPDHGQLPAEPATSRPPTTADAAEPSANEVTVSPDCSGV